MAGSSTSLPPVATENTNTCTQTYAQNFQNRTATDHLSVNTSAQHYSIRMSEENGLRELQGLTATATTEEAWIYISTKEGTGTQPTGTWYEIGECETQNSSSINNALFNKALSLHDPKSVEKIVFYHFHPGFLIEQSFDSGMSLSSMAPSPPSDKDLLSLVQMAKKIRETYPSVKPLMGIVTSDQLWTLSLNTYASFSDDAVWAQEIKKEATYLHSLFSTGEIEIEPQSSFFNITTSALNDASAIEKTQPDRIIRMTEDGTPFPNIPSPASEK